LVLVLVLFVGGVVGRAAARLAKRKVVRCIFCGGFWIEGVGGWFERVLWYFFQMRGVRLC
jgi:hypothetical protein